MSNSSLARLSVRALTVGLPKSLSSFLNLGDPRPDLATLVELVADGSLRVDIGWRGPLEQFPGAGDALRDRRVEWQGGLDLRLPTA